MKSIILFLLLNASVIYSMQTITGISRQNFGAEFLDNLKKENRGRFGKNLKFMYSDVTENLFNVYDASFLSFVWPKLRTGVHLNVGNACFDDFGVLFKDLLQGRAWAYSAVDSSGRYNSGLLQGNHFWLGSKQECFQLENSFAEHPGNDTYHEFRNNDYLYNLQRQGKQFGMGDDWYTMMERDDLMQRIVEADKVPPFKVSFVTVKILLNVSKPTLIKSYGITLGLCVPRTCTFEDINRVLDFSVMINDNLKSNKSLPRIVQVSTIKRVEASYDVKNDAGAIVLILFTVLLLFIVVFATMLDLGLVKLRAVNTKSMSFDLERPPIENGLPIQNKTNTRSYKSMDLLSIPKTHNCTKNIQPKNINVVDMETLTINNINNTNQINLVTVKKIMKPDAKPPSITLDVVAVDAVKNNCQRCGKYKRQCFVSNESNGLTSCSRINKYNTYEAVSVKSENIKCKRNTFLKGLLLCFSIKYSFKRIFNTNMANRDLCAIHTLKIMATFWMILVHVSLIISYISENGGGMKHNNSVYNIFSIGTLAFDTLFFISGALSAHHFFYLKSQYTTKELVSFGGAFGQILQFVCFVTNRAIRLLPSYMYVMFLGAYVARTQHWTSVLELPENDHSTCDTYWWRNLLYINTFYDKKDRCMQWSWYLSAETQLHALGMLAVCLSRRVKLVLVVVTSALAAMVTADVVMGIKDFRVGLPDAYAAYDALIERGWARPAPYFVGLFTGWMVHKLDGQLKIGKMTSTCLWLSSLVVMTSAFLKPWSVRALGVTGETVLSSLTHSFWALAMVWPVVVFATVKADWSRRVLSCRLVAALSRLSYGVFLLHGVVARALILGPDRALTFDAGTILLYLVSTSALSVLGSFVLSLLLETPCCSLLRRLTDCASA